MIPSGQLPFLPDTSRIFLLSSIPDYYMFCAPDSFNIYYYNFLVSHCFTFHFRDNKIRWCLIRILKLCYTEPFIGLHQFILTKNRSDFHHICHQHYHFIMSWGASRGPDLFGSKTGPFWLPICPMKQARRRNFHYILLPQQ